MTNDDLALAQLVAAATSGQLAGYAVAAGLIPASPDVQSAERLAHLSRSEFDDWVRLRSHLGELTDLPDGLLTRQRPLFDEFFAGATEHGWEHGCTALAFGWSIANDFLTRIAPRLPDETRNLVEQVCASREVERFALAQLQGMVTTDGDRERIRGIVAELLGRALAGFQRAMQDTDALEVLLDADDDAPGVASRQFAVDLLASHRARLSALGIDDPD